MGRKPAPLPVGIDSEEMLHEVYDLDEDGDDCDCDCYDMYCPHMPPSPTPGSPDV